MENTTDAVTKKIPQNNTVKHDNTLNPKMAARPGFEPRQTGPKPVVLPLHHRATKIYIISRQE